MITSNHFLNFFFKIRNEPYIFSEKLIIAKNTISIIGFSNYMGRDFPTPIRRFYYFLPLIIFVCINCRSKVLLSTVFLCYPFLIYYEIINLFLNSD